MNWSNVKLILAREIRDQLRDRRTLFMIAVLPMLLYPLLGMSMFQIAQFVREKTTRVLMVGGRDLEGLPPLIEDGRFAPGLFADPEKGVGLLDLHFPESKPGGQDNETADPRAAACRAVEAGEYEAVLYFPKDFGDQARAFQQAIQQWRRENGDGTKHDVDAPVLDVHPEIIYSTASEESQITFARLSDVWRRWNEQIGRSNLTARGLPANAAKPFELATTNLADETGRHGAAVWAKILPVLLLLWAMTGAFYPAVDLCAGEKERGTLETLLCSPAERSEIVMGKLLTIMLFSAATAVLNLISLGVTGWLVLAKLPQFGPPPPTAALWLAIALVPVSALFSALCLALAAFARSSKEGQYYLIPLLLVTLPLVILPMAPGVELNLGNSLIPVTGVVLLLRSMLEGNHWQAMQFAAPVVAVTLACCFLAIRWAVEQFNSESVLFRESERLDVGLWIRHLLVDRRPTPTVAAAVTCGVLILLVRFFMSFAVPEPVDFRGFALVAVATQLVVVLAPTLLMTRLLTGSPRQTLLLRRPVGFSLAAAAALAVVLHPAVRGVQSLVARLYPINEDILKPLEAIFREAPAFWQLIVVVAVVPAVCEELAFRGFILSGFRHLGSKRRAIVYSALFFGFTHGVLQQSIVASVLGVVIGYVAVQSGSILPGIVFHLIHNTLAVASTRPEITETLSDCGPLLGKMLFTVEQGGLAFRWPAVVISVVLASALLVWFGRLPCVKSEEERQRDAILKGSRDE